jgi:ADP-heptose:LPS heptosyltransferase
VFIKLAEQGSTVLAWPAISNAIARVGRDRVYFLVFEENRALLDALEWIPRENILSIRARDLGTVATGVYRTIRKLRQAGVDTVIDLEFFARSSAILSYVSGATRRVGFHAYAGEAGHRGDLSTHRVSFNPLLHTSHAFEMLVDALDREPADFPAFGMPPPALEALPEFRPLPADTASVTLLLESVGCAASPRVLLNANASDLLPLRRWPPERYVEMARRMLADDPACRVIFTGGPGEGEATAALVAQVGNSRCVSLAGKTTFRDLLTLYSLSDVLVTNDSGPAHFAALTAIQVVTLFGPETPTLFAALTPRNQPLTAGLVCSPCVNAFNDRQSSCTNNLCMQMLTVDQVYEAAVRARARRRQSQP